MKKHLTLLLGAAAAILLTSNSLRADVWVEIPDAGQTIPTGQYTGVAAGNPLTMITGTLGSPGDVDLFRIQINSPSLFSASTVNALTAGSGLDTELFLFADNGAAIYANDDDPGGASLQSTLPAGHALGPIAAGRYWLAIATSGAEPVNFANTLLFTPDSPSFTVRGPAVNVPGGLSNWDTSFSDPGVGAYEIDLTGAFTAVPEPSTYLAGALTLGLVGFSVLRRRRLALNRAVSAVVLFLGLAVSAAFATDIPQNMGPGLNELLQSNKALKSGVQGLYNGFATEEAANYAGLAIRDEDSGKFMIDIHPNGTVSTDEMVAKLPGALSSLEITAVDTKYHGVGVIEGLISLDDIATLANDPSVSSVQLGFKPYHRKTAAAKAAVKASQTKNSKGDGTRVPSVNAPLTLVGTFFDQGVTQHRVDKVSQLFNPAAPINMDGTGMSVGCISDSFATNATAPTAATNVAALDLPGDPGNPYNTTPVAALQDFAGGTDEGRGMCQIVYKMAPRAKVGFATADFGEVGFANNIRALAGIAGFTYPGQTFKADTICDDVGYFDEPFYTDGAIGNGVDDAVAAGVSYFSSAANDVDVNGYESVIRLVPNGTGLTFAAGNTALINTNVNLTGVPTNLYAGGFHNFDPSGNPATQDVAQTVNIAANNTVSTVLQWNDPYDFNAGFIPGTQIYSNTGSFTATAAGGNVQFDNTSTPPLPALTAGQAYILTEGATSGSYDAVITIINPDNTTLITQDTGVDEIVRFIAPQTGNYKFQFGHFAATTGTFSFNLNQASSVTPFVMSDWNLLAFRVDTGAYVAASSLATNNLLTNQPFELGFTNRTSAAISAIQFVLARANTPPPGQFVADHIRYLIPGNGRAGYGPAEYFSYGAPTTAGHAIAEGTNGCAAYSVFRPSIPQAFTSPGPAVIYWDKNNQRLIPPVIRLKPTLAAADTANTTWPEATTVSQDSTADGDTTNNFSGTSAAGPHAAVIAALVLQKHGGSGSVTPAQMRTILTTTAFPHDLDPYYSSGSVKTSNGGKVQVSVLSDNSANNGFVGNVWSSASGTGTNDANSMSVAYAGPGFIKSITFNPNGLATQGGNVTGGNNGVDSTNTYFSNVYPGMVFAPASKAFTVGNLSSLAAADVVAAVSNLPPAPSIAGQGFTLGLTFPNNNFTGGKALRFTIGRNLQHSANVGTFAAPQGGAPFAGPASGTAGGVNNSHGDLLGGGVLIPENQVTTGGMVVSGVMSDNSTFQFTMQNRIGSGWTNLDGFGFINAEAAVNAPLP